MKSNGVDSRIIARLAREEGISKGLLSKALRTDTEPRRSRGRELTITTAKKPTKLYEEGEKLARVQTEFTLPNILAFNILKKHGYAGSWSDFVNECIAIATGLHPDLAVDCDPEIIKLRKEIRKADLTRELKGKRVDIERELNKAIKYGVFARILDDLRSGV